MKFDCELEAKDVQDLAGADALAAFFAKLGYNTDARTEQTPANLGITADGTKRPINRIELLADQESLLQVYLFEVKSVTVTHIRALARTFRNRAGNYLLVLTSDYERLDFVLIDKELPTAAGPSKGIAQKQVVVRPRMLTVQRRNPDRVHLRVLRRFTYTEADPVAQYDKLRSAYGIAEWSEEFFNNRALFSDYYLLERLRDRDEWAEDPKPTYQALRELYEGAASTFANQPEQKLRSNLLEPALEALGFSFKPGKKARSEEAEPDYRLLSPDDGDAPLAVCLTYPWGRSLDGKDDRRDTETPDENPNFVVVSLLERDEVSWAVVTNGKAWRLYSARAHAKATNYYEVDLEEVLAAAGPHAGGPADAFRYFWLLFRRQALEPQTVTREGKEQTLCFLDQLLTESEEYAKELGERLKERVFVEIFPHVSEGFITCIRQEEGKDADLPQERLDQVFQGTLTLLYRLLFLLYAESRDLLPVRETRGYYEISLTKLKGEIAEAAGPIADEVAGKLKRHYSGDSYDLYGRLMRLFGAVDRGDPTVNVPFYNGGLFITRPGDDDRTPEAANARFLNAHKVPDRHLARAVDLLARDPDPKRQDLVRLDYKSLGVRHLGSIYEGLLEFKLRIAERKLGVKKTKGREVFEPFRKLGDRQKKRAERDGKVVRKGEVYLENDKRERKATGSYYTPDNIVEYIVEHTVGPVLDEKFEAVRPLVRDAQQERQAFFKQQAAHRKKGLPEKNPAQADLKGRKEVIPQLFDIKVLDPAMGSGHFLVEAVDFITDRMLDFLHAFPWNPVSAYLEETRQTILDDVERQGVSIDPSKLTDVNLLKRHVLKRSIYGVDLNPMAVELAKVSLWLDCFTLGAPLSFLDHHVKCGNSLVGATVAEVSEALESGETALLGIRFAGLMLATDLMRHVGELSDVTSAQVQESRQEYRKAADALAPFKRILDVYTSRWFGNEPQKSRRRKGRTVDPAMEFLGSAEGEAWAHDPDTWKGFSDWDEKVVERTLAAVQAQRFFHWELEFPEAFYGESECSAQKIVRKEDAGFDAVVGNPPYDELSEHAAGRELPEKEYFKQHPMYQDALGGRLNVFRLFVIRALSVLSAQGRQSFIVPMSLLADSFTASLRRRLLEDGLLRTVVAFPQKDDPHRRIFFDAKLSTCVYVAENPGNSAANVAVTTYPANTFNDEPRRCAVTVTDLRSLDPDNLSIPAVGQSDIGAWRVIRDNPRVATWREVAKCYLGELMTNASNKHLTSEEPVGPRLLRGANINYYLLLDEPKQGTPLYLREKQFLEEYQNDVRSSHHLAERVGFQESCPIDNWRRLIACMIPPGHYCVHKIRYFAPDAKYDLHCLLAIFNSNMADWRFSLTSTNNSLSAYEIDVLPIPRFERLRQAHSNGTVAHQEPREHTLQGSVEEWEVDVLAEMAEQDESGETWPDSIHEALASAGKEMSRLGEERQQLSNEFSDWLVEELGIDEERFTGVTRLRGGQADFDQMGWDEFLRLLKRNHRACAADIDKAASKVEKQYAKVSGQLTANRARFAALDAAIDRVVWRLVGLNPDGSLPEGKETG